MKATGKPIDTNKTLGENLAANGESLARSASIQGPVEAAGGGKGSDPGYVPATADEPAGDETDYDKIFEDLLASRPREAQQPRSLLADELSSRVGRQAAPAQSPVTDTPAAPMEFASATMPETPIAAAPVEGQPQAPSLAELFTVKEIGMPNEIDPVTGQPRPFRSRRAYG